MTSNMQRLPLCCLFSLCILLYCSIPSVSLLRESSFIHSSNVLLRGTFRSRLRHLVRVHLNPPSASSTISELLTCIQSSPSRRRALDYVVDVEVVKQLHAGQIKTILAALIDAEAKENLITFCTNLCKLRRFPGHLLYLALHLANKKGSLSMTSTLFDIAINNDFNLDIEMLNKIIEVFLMKNQVVDSLALLEDMHKDRFGYDARMNENTFELVLRSSSQMDNNNFLVQVCHLAANPDHTSRAAFIDLQDEASHRGHSREYRELLETLLRQAFQHCHYTDDLPSCIDLLPILRAHLSLSAFTLDTCYALAIQTFLHSLRTPYWQLISREQVIAQVVGGLDQGVIRPLLSRGVGVLGMGVIMQGEGERLSPLLHDLVLRYIANRNNIDALGSYLSLVLSRSTPRPSPLTIMEVYEALGRGEGRKVEDIKGVWNALMTSWDLPAFSYDAPLTSMLSPISIRDQPHQQEERDNVIRNLAILGKVQCEIDVQIRRRGRQIRVAKSNAYERSYVSSTTMCQQQKR